jgi:hypothetical protein
MRRLPPSVFAVAGFVLACGTAAALAAPQASSPVLSAPPATPARAAADAGAALSRITLPAGSQRLAAAPRALRGSSGPDFTMAYATFKTATAYWRLANGAAATALLAQAPRGSSTWSYPGELSGAQITLPARGGWLGPRWLVIETRPDPGAAGRWLAEIQAVAVWTPWRLELPGAVASVTVRRLQDGAVLADVTDAGRVARIVAAVNALAVDDAIHAVYACPFGPAGKLPGFELSFTDSTGALLATAKTEWCPLDVSLKVGTHAPQQLIAGNLVATLERILGIALPPAF